jgi:adenylate cyclase
MPVGNDSPATASGAASEVIAAEDRLHEVFISYASADSAIANALVTALERAGLPCWIAPRDVTPGALYADVIIRAINGAQALVLVLSQNSISSSHVGKEVERASAKHRPIIAVRTDPSPLTPALEYFLSESQWIDVATDDVETVAVKVLAATRRLSAARAEPGPFTADATRGVPVPGNSRRKPGVDVVLWVVLAAVLAGFLYLLADKFGFPRRQSIAVSAVSAPGPASAPNTAKVAAPPPHSIAVLPFANLSGDPKEDYFSDGLSEELLNALAAVPDLRVAARTSSFMFKGKNAAVGDIARELNVGAVLEGSVRKEGSEVRITAQLINALTGFHLWSHTYDRDLKNVLALQTEIANAVTQALQATLLSGVAVSTDLGGTKNPDALDAYLQGKYVERESYDQEHIRERVRLFQQAVRLDPQFAKAYVGLALSQTTYVNNFGAFNDEERTWRRAAPENAEKAVALAPELGEAHAALAYALERLSLDSNGALSEYERALQLAPGDSPVLLRGGLFLVTMGRTQDGLAEVRKGAASDQLNPNVYSVLALSYQYARQYREAVEAAHRAIELNPASPLAKSLYGLNELLAGDTADVEQPCTTTPAFWLGRVCLALLYDRLHRHGEAQAQLTALQSELKDASAYQYAEIYAQRGDLPKALDWLDVAYRVRDPGIGNLRVDVLVDPLRKEPRFQAMERKLNLPPVDSK